MNKVLLFWSSGKDSAMAFQKLIAEGYTVAALVTTMRPDGTIPHHEVPLGAVMSQARAIGLPLWQVPLPDPCSNAFYERLMGELLEQARQQGFFYVAFGDLFLEDIRQYRTQLVERHGLVPLFPIWTGAPQASLTYARQVLESGIRAVVSAVDASRLPSQLVGSPYDESFILGLPSEIDPAGEYGEFHTFVWEAPFFSLPVEKPPLSSHPA